MLFPKHEQTLQDAECFLCWLESTHSPRVHCHPPSSSLSIPTLRRGSQFAQFAAFSAQFPTVGCVDLCNLDLTELSEEHMANEESVPSLATAFSEAAPDPQTRAGL